MIQDVTLTPVMTFLFDQPALNLETSQLELSASHK